MEQIPSTPPQPTEQPPPQNPQPPHADTSSVAIPTDTSSLPPDTTTISFPNPNSPPTHHPPIAPQSQQQSTPASQTRPPFNTRPWEQHSYPHFSLPSSPLPASSAPTSSAVSGPSPPRGGMAIGVPAQFHSAHPPPPASFSSITPPSYSQQSQIRQPMQGMGITGALGTTPSMRPPHQTRPSQSSLRPQASSSTPSPTMQNFQGHSMLGVSSLGTPGSSSSSPSQHSQTRPWLSSGHQGKPPLPSPSLRPQASPQNFQQRSHITQHNTPTTSQQQPPGTSQLSSQPSTSGQPQEHFSPQFPASRVQQSISHQQQMTRGPGLGSQRPTLGGVTQSKNVSPDTDESSNRVVSKRSIQELVNQIDPSEKLDPEVEDILVDIAEDFVESITSFGCSLAKHRKSTTLEAKDIILHLEKNWNMTLPGFGGDEIKVYKKPTVTEIHRERLAAVKKSILVNDMMSKNTNGPSGGNAKSHLAKGPA